MLLARQRFPAQGIPSQGIMCKCQAISWGHCLKLIREPGEQDTEHVDVLPIGCARPDIFVDCLPSRLLTRGEKAGFGEKMSTCKFGLHQGFDFPLLEHCIRPCEGTLLRTLGRGYGNHVTSNSECRQLLMLFVRCGCTVGKP